MRLRYERKYLVPYTVVDALRSRILPFVKADIYACLNGEKLPQYTVRSIYFDTSGLECHQEKTEGVKRRSKFRIRCYNTYKKDSDAVFEIKKKLGDRILKFRAFTKYDYVEPLLESSNLDKYISPGESNGFAYESASRFFYHLKKRHLIPTVLVSYEREAYQGKFDPGVRITFDKNIRSMIYPEITDMFKNQELKHLFSNHFILEVKYFTQHMPSWVKPIIQEFRLRHEALSKYTIGYDVNVSKQLFTY